VDAKALFAIVGAAVDCCGEGPLLMERTHFLAVGVGGWTRKIRECEAGSQNDKFAAAGPEWWRPRPRPTQRPRRPLLLLQPAQGLHCPQEEEQLPGQGTALPHSC